MNLREEDSFRNLAIFWQNEIFLKNFNFWHHIRGKGVKIRLFYAWSFFHQLHRFGDRKKKSHFQAPFQLFFCINQLPTWENDDFWQKKMSDYFFRFSKCSLWSLKILCLTFNYQLISWCFGVSQIFLAICPVNLRYSRPKSAEKWPFPQQNKIQKKFLAKFLIFQGAKRGPFWPIQVLPMVLGDDPRWSWEVPVKKLWKQDFHFQESADNHGTSPMIHDIYHLRVTLSLLELSEPCLMVLTSVSVLAGVTPTLTKPLAASKKHLN